MYANPDIKVFQNKYELVNDRKEKIYSYAFPSLDNQFKALCSGNFMACIGGFLHREVYTKIQFDTTRELTGSEDYEYWLRLGKSGVRFAYLEEKLAGSRLYAENKTLGARVKVHKEINDMFKKSFAKVPDRWLLNYAHAVVESKIDRRLHPMRFVIQIGWRTILASFRWNRSFSVDMQNRIFIWARKM